MNNVQRLPVSASARAMYWHMRKNTWPREECLAQAHEIDSCPDAFCCAKCGTPLDTRNEARIRNGGLEVWCGPCVGVPR
jgi:hypothetical protein